MRDRFGQLKAQKQQKMKFFYKIIFLLTLLIPSVAQAQFYVTGDDPGRLRWNFIDTESFRIIYPQGSDTLAREYAFKLEKYKVPVSLSTGKMVGQGDGKLMPVVLHTFNGANGSVAWAPKRMDLFTIPTAYDPEPMPWSTMLSVHEGRHVTQMQFGMMDKKKGFKYVFGEMWNILASLVYPGMYLVEGDAVIAETALTPSGRGRTADFLNYYRIAFDNGDLRSWDRWKFGSQKYFAPDRYALGYMTYGGIRYIYDYPDFLKDGYDVASQNVIGFVRFKNIIKDNRTGLKIRNTFEVVRDTMQAMWNRDAQARAPFIYAEEVSNPSSVYTNYSHTAIIGNDIYTIKSGYQHSPTLIKIDDQGNETRIRSMSHEMSDLVPFGNSLIWSEEIPDERWSMKSDSKIRVINPDNGKKTPGRFNLAGNENVPIYNPSVSEESDIAAVEYLPEGGTALWEGLPTPAPDSLQLVETAWIGNYIYATAISDNGFGIYALDREEAYARHVRLTTGRELWTVVLEPQPVKIKDFKAYGNELMFTSDRTGVNELYHLNPTTGELRQKTVTKYGAEDFVYGNNGFLYYSAPTLNGLRMYRTPVDSLMNRKVNFTEKYSYIIADCLSEQENRLAAEAGLDKAVDEDLKVEDVYISEPKRYRKAAHMFNIHSWAPIYVNVDNIMNMSYDYIFQAASLGATAIMQNRLATGVGEFGYSAHKDPYDKTKWRHSGHFKFTYSGLYPVIEAKFDINDRAARQYNVKAIKSGEGASIGLYSGELAVPYMEGKLSAYIPLTFNSGGWYKGVIPKLTYRISNDMFNTSITVLEQNPSPMYPPGNAPFAGVIDGKNRFRHSLTGSLRGYTSLSTPNSAAYPRWGIGAEIGASANLESLDILSPMGYGYIYGYVPGITREQGLKLSVMHQQKLSDKAIFSTPLVNVLPRGLASNADLTTYMSIQNPAITRFSADYAIPIYIGDISIGRGLMYVKRLCLTPHVDYTMAGKTNLLSVGTALTVDLNALFWIAWPVSIGATYSYSGLADYNIVKSQTGIDMEPHHAGFVFNVSF